MIKDLFDGIIIFIVVVVFASLGTWIFGGFIAMVLSFFEFHEAGDSVANLLNWDIFKYVVVVYAVIMFFVSCKAFVSMER